MKSSFVIANIETGKLNALVKNLMRQINISDPHEALRLMNSGEWLVSPMGRDFLLSSGTIFFSLPPSDGTTGAQWIKRLEAASHSVDDSVKESLLSPAFIPTSGITYIMAILRGSLFPEHRCTTIEARKFGRKFGFEAPHPEASFLMREMLTNAIMRAMRIQWITMMHSPYLFGSAHHLFSIRKDGDASHMSVRNHDSHLECVDGVNGEFALEAWRCTR